MIGIVVVSHSRRLADAAVELARQMVPGGRGPRLVVAAGLDETTLGTDATAVAAAITEADSPDGVLVFTDFGSAVLSAETALEFIESDVAARVRITPAPLVEGLVAAVVRAAAGGSLTQVESEALAGLDAKARHLAAAPPPAAHDEPEPAGRLQARVRAPEPMGLHVRPIAAIVATVGRFDAVVRISDLSRGTGPADALSPTDLASLGAVAGDGLLVESIGTQAADALAALISLAEANFGDPRRPAAPIREPAESRTITGPVRRLTFHVEPDPGGPGPAEEELLRRAKAAVTGFLGGLGDDRTEPIFCAQAALLDDPAIGRGLRRRLVEGASAAQAWDAELTGAAARLEAVADPALRERAQDLRSLRRLVLLALAGRPLVEPPPAEPAVIVVEELDAATAATLDPRVALAVVTTVPGQTGHGIQVARHRGIPVFTGRAEAVRTRPGQRVTIDAVTGSLRIEPLAD